MNDDQVELVKRYKVAADSASWAAAEARVHSDDRGVAHHELEMYVWRTCEELARLGAEVDEDAVRREAKLATLEGRPTIGAVNEGARLGRALDRIEAFLKRYVAFASPSQPLAVALWVAHTHLIAAFDDSPRLSIRSPEMRSGKTRLLECVELLAFAPMQVVSMSEAALFRLVASEPITVLWDEVDAIFGPDARNKEDLRALINTGTRRGAVVVRMVGEGKRMRHEKFAVFAPVALTGIGTLPGTIEDRCIIIGLRRRRGDEQVTKLRRRRVTGEADDLRADLADACEAVRDQLGHADPVMPYGLNDRAEDCWAPLLAIADAAGDRWGKRAREAAQKLAEASDEVTIGLQLLEDCRTIFEDADLEELTPTGLAERLNDLEESPWSAFGKSEKPITANKVSRMLKPYGVKVRIERAGKSTQRLFHAADFLDAWQRYLAPLVKTRKRVNL